MVAVLGPGRPALMHCYVGRLLRGIHSANAELFPEDPPNLCVGLSLLWLFLV